MSVLGGVLGGLLSFGSSAVSSAMQYAMSKAGQKRQYQYQRKLNQQAYDLTQKGYTQQFGNIRTGLESAGYNPILATDMSAGGNFSGGTAVNANPTQAPDVSGTINAVSNAYKTYKLDRDLNRATIENLGSQTDLTNAKTKTEGYNQQLLHSQYLLNQINTELAKKDLSWKDRMYLMQEKAGYMSAVAAHLGAEAQQLNANTAKQHLNLDKEMMSYQRDKERIEKAWRERHPHQANWQAGLGQWTGSLGNIFTGSGSKLLKK